MPGTDPAFSPDGTKIAYITRRTISRSSTPTARARRRSTPNAGDAQPDWQEIQAATPEPARRATSSYPTINLQSGDPQPVARALPHGERRHLGRRVLHHLHLSVEALRRGRSVERPVREHRRRDVELLHADARPTSASACASQVTATNGQGTASQNSESSAPVIALPVKLRVTPQILGGNVVDTPLSLTAGIVARLDADHVHLLVAALQSGRRPCRPASRFPARLTAVHADDVQDIGFCDPRLDHRHEHGGLRPGDHEPHVPDRRQAAFQPERRATAPTIAGTVTTGRQLTADVGSYDGDMPIKTTFVWQRCDATGADCHVIPTAKKVVYFPTVRTSATRCGSRSLRRTRTESSSQPPTPTEPCLGDAAACSRTPHRRHEQRRVPRRRRPRRRDLRSRRQRHAARRRRRRPDRRRRGQRRHHRRQRERTTCTAAPAPTRSTRPTASATSSTADPGNDRAVVDDSVDKTVNCEVVVTSSSSSGRLRRNDYPGISASRCANASRRWRARRRAR